jgi:hypothetical protein
VMMTPSLAADWSLEIVPTDVTEEAAGITLNELTPEFHVILRNTSEHPLKIWKERCSAGWFNLSFRIKRTDGTTFEIRKAGRGWTWNGPDPYLVFPKRSFVWSVKFGKDWILPTDLKVPTPVQMTAVFEEEQDGDLKKGMVGPKDEARMTARENVLSKILEQGPYDQSAAAELATIRKPLLFTRLGKDLWIGRVQSEPLSVMLQKPQQNY